MLLHSSGIVTTILLRKAWNYQTKGFQTKIFTDKRKDLLSARFRILSGKKLDYAMSFWRVTTFEAVKFGKTEIYQNFSFKSLPIFPISSHLTQARLLLKATRPNPNKIRIFDWPPIIPKPPIFTQIYPRLPLISQIFPMHLSVSFNYPEASSHLPHFPQASCYRPF